MDRDHGPGFWAEGARHAHEEWWSGPLHLLFLAAALALLVLGIIWLVRMLAEGRPSAVAAPLVTAPPAGAMLVPPPGLDPALTELRLRYARGDVDRDTYLQSFADLTGRTEPWPGQEEPTASG